MNVDRLIMCTTKSRQKMGVTVTDGGIAIDSLVAKSAAGDFEAFGELYAMYLDRIYRYVFYQVKDKMAAEDLTEEIFMKAWKAIGSYKGKERTFLSWLYRIAHNHVIDSFRTRRQNSSLDMETATGSSDPMREAERNLEEQEILRLVSCLPPKQKEVIILKFIEGLDNRDIQEITGKSQGAIRAIQMRALATLRQRLTQGVIGEWSLNYQEP